MISKELLSDVIGYEVKEFNTTHNIVYVTDKYNNDEKINIHELAHKCKEWAKENGYAVIIEQIDQDTHNGHKWYLGLNKNYWFHGEHEPNLVFKACQWILESKKD